MAASGISSWVDAVTEQEEHLASQVILTFDAFLPVLWRCNFTTLVESRQGEFSHVVSLSVRDCFIEIIDLLTWAR